MSATERTPHPLFHRRQHSLCVERPTRCSTGNPRAAQPPRHGPPHTDMRIQSMRCSLNHPDRDGGCSLAADTRIGPRVLLGGRQCKSAVGSIHATRQRASHRPPPPPSPLLPPPPPLPVSRGVIGGTWWRPPSGSWTTPARWAWCSGCLMPAGRCVGVGEAVTQAPVRQQEDSAAPPLPRPRGETRTTWWTRA
jgi:hypothetical protein